MTNPQESGRKRKRISSPVATSDTNKIKENGLSSRQVTKQVIEDSKFEIEPTVEIVNLQTDPELPPSDQPISTPIPKTRGRKKLSDTKSKDSFLTIEELEKLEYLEKKQSKTSY